METRAWPTEIVQRICEIIYLDSVPLCSLRLLDPAAVPSAAFDGQLACASIEETTRILYTLCLVSRQFYRFASPLLSRRVQIQLPFRFTLLSDLAAKVDMAAPGASSTLSHIRMLDFSSFSTLGLRRKVGQSVEQRFVTEARLLQLLQATTGLVAFGCSDTMDSALTLSVLEALLFRDGESSRPSRMRDVSMERPSQPVATALQSLDFCGCVSTVFLQAMSEFVHRHLDKVSAPRAMYDLLEEDTAFDEDEEADRRGRTRVPTVPRPRQPSRHRMASHSRRREFPSLQRLGMTGVSLPRDILAPFVLSFPHLTHLDLSQTRVDAAMLDALANSTVQLESLSLSRCRALTSESITNLLVASPTTVGLVELALQGTVLFPTPLSQEDLRTILQHAPCIRRGALRYLDLGACPLGDEELALFPPQHSLLDLGLGAIPQLTLRAIAQFLQETAPNVQILDLTHSACASAPLHAVELYHELLAPCTQRPPSLEIAHQLKSLGLRSVHHDGGNDASEWQAPTNLRVVELSASVLETVRGGVAAWKVIWGAGRRGWVVDTAAGPAPQAFDIPVPEEVTVRGRGMGTARVRRSAGSVERHTALSEPEERGRGKSVAPQRAAVSPAPSHRSQLMATPTIAMFESRSRSLSLSRGDAPRGRRMPAERSEPAQIQPQVARNLSPEHARRTVLEHWSGLQTSGVPGSLGWHSHKMEVLLGYGLLGHEAGSYAWWAYQTP